VVIPHSGVVIPNEVPLETLSEDFFVLVQNVDWYTNWLYDFRDILGNRHLVFQYCSIVVEGNRHPEILDDSVPLMDVRGRPVYIAGLEPSKDLRASLSSKYLKPFHSMIENNIAEGGFLWDTEEQYACLLLCLPY
jgi:N-formylglutamate amidohydrolase